MGMKLNSIILFVFTLFLFGCKSSSIVVLDYDTQEPIANAMVFTEEYRICSTKQRIHTTNKDGILDIDYHPMIVVALKEGYSPSFGGDVPSIIYLTNLKSQKIRQMKPNVFKYLENFKHNPMYDKFLKYKKEYHKQINDKK